MELRKAPGNRLLFLYCLKDVTSRQAATYSSNSNKQGKATGEEKHIVSQKLFHLTSPETCTVSHRIALKWKETSYLVYFFCLA